MHVARSFGRGTLAAFFTWLLVLSVPLWALAWAWGSGSWSMGVPKAREWFVTAIMWCPGLAALIACATTRTSSASGTVIFDHQYIGTVCGCGLVSRTRT